MHSRFVPTKKVKPAREERANYNARSCGRVVRHGWRILVWNERTKFTDHDINNSVDSRSARARDAATAVLVEQQQQQLPLQFSPSFSLICGTVFYVSSTTIYAIDHRYCFPDCSSISPFIPLFFFLFLPRCFLVILPHWSSNPVGESLHATLKEEEAHEKYSLTLRIVSSVNPFPASSAVDQRDSHKLVIFTIDV